MLYKERIFPYKFFYIQDLVYLNQKYIYLVFHKQFINKIRTRLLTIALSLGSNFKKFLMVEKYNWIV